MKMIIYFILAVLSIAILFPRKISASGTTRLNLYVAVNSMNQEENRALWDVCYRQSSAYFCGERIGATHANLLTNHWYYDIDWSQSIPADSKYTNAGILLPGKVEKAKKYRFYNSIWHKLSNFTVGTDIYTSNLAFDLYRCEGNCILSGSKFGWWQQEAGWIKQPQTYKANSRFIDQTWLEENNPNVYYILAQKVTNSKLKNQL